MNGLVLNCVEGLFQVPVNILLTNDDGIRAPGLWAAARELSRIAHVTVVAPAREQSGVGTSLSLHNPVYLKKEASDLPDLEAYSVEGTPGDSVILALRIPLVDTPDLVVSGINEGANLGDDVFISGTVGAALQGYFNGVSAISVSVAALEVTNFQPAARAVSLLAEQLRYAAIPGRILLNVNLPDEPAEGLVDFCLTKLAQRKSVENVQEDGKERHFWIRRGHVEWSDKEGTDRWAVTRKKGSMTPLMASPRRPPRPLLHEIAATVFAGLSDSVVKVA